MAHIFPNRINFCKSNAEKQLYNVFKTFSDDFYIIHSLPWLSSHIANSIGRYTPEGEIDFILLHKKYGILCIEVKGGRVTYNQHAYFTNGKRLDKDPYIQARDNNYFIIEYISEITKNIVIGNAVGFPESKPSMPNDNAYMISFNIDDISSLENKMILIFKYWNSERKGKSEPTLEIINTIIEKLVPSSLEELNSKIEYDNKNWLILSEKQTDIISEAIKSNKYFVSGRAGTGKTVLAVILGRVLSTQNLNVLFLTFNVEINNYINEEFLDDENIDVKTFHKYLSTNNKNKNLKPTENDNEILTEITKYISNKYDVLIIDEAQSLNKIWLNKLSKYFSNKRIYIFSDELQSFIYEGQVSNDNLDKIFHFDKKIFLSKNYRSPFKVYKRLLELFSSSIEQTTPRSSDMLDLLEIITDEPTEKLHKTIDKLLDEDSIKSTEMTILISSKESKSIIENYRNVQIQTVGKYRGMEKPIIIYIITSASKKDLHELYIAYSRSTTQTIVIIPKHVIAFGKTHFEKMLLESEVSDKKIKNNVNHQVLDYENKLIKEYNLLKFKSINIYYTNKYIFFNISRLMFIHRLFIEYFFKLGYTSIQMEEKYLGKATCKSNIFEQTFLEYTYCNSCFEETFVTNGFCLNCKIKDLITIDIRIIKSKLHILNYPKKYSGVILNTLEEEIRTIGRFFYTGLDEIITDNVAHMLNSQWNITKISGIIEILIILKNKKINKISLKEIREHKGLKQLNGLKDNWISQSALCTQEFLQHNFFEKVNKSKGLYIFNYSLIFKSKN